MALRNSAELSSAILVRLRPYIQALGPPPSTPNQNWLNAASSAVRQVVSNILRALLNEQQLPYELVSEQLEHWLVRVSEPVQVLVSPSINTIGYELAVMNLGTVSQRVFESQPRVPAPSFVRNIRHEVASRADSFTLSLEERALRNTIAPSVGNTHLDGRARMAAKLQEDLRLEHERKTKAEVEKKELEKTGFGRLIDLDD